MISQVLPILSVLSWLTFPDTHRKRMILPTDRVLSTVWHITCIYWMLVWMISQVLPIISVLSCLACPYTPCRRMILHNDQLLSTCYIKYIYIYIGCLNEWYRVLSIMNVLSYFTCPIHLENAWSCLLINSMLYIMCLHEWYRLPCESYVRCPTSDVHMHIENEWSYPFINFHLQYDIWDVYIGCLYEWSRLSCQS